MIIMLLLSSVAFAIIDNNEHHLFNAPEVHQGSVLNIENCVSLAFKNSPKVKRKKYELDIAKSNVKLAQSRFFPTLSGLVGFQYERNSNSVYYDKKYRDLPNVIVSVSQLIWDFGKTNANIKMEKFYKIVAEYEFIDELCHTLFDIKAKYYELLRLDALRKIANENIDLNKEFLSISINDVDKSTTQVYLTDAYLKYTTIDGDFDIAKIDLSNAMYLDKKIDFSITNTPTFGNEIFINDIKTIKFPFKQENAIDIAYKNSPDLQVLINTKSAMEESLKYTKRQFAPELSAGIGYGINNTNFATNNSLYTSVNLTESVKLMEMKYSIDEAKSKIDIAENEISLFKNDLFHEVRRGIENTDFYEKLLPKFKKEVEQAKGNLNLSIQNYKSKKIDYVALHNARKDFIEAKEKYVDCLYKYNMSLIQTEMAMHYHIVDIHDKAEHAMHHHANELIEHLNDALDCDKKENRKKK